MSMPRRFLDGLALSCTLAPVLLACTTGGMEYTPSIDAADVPTVLGFVVEGFPSEMDELANRPFTIKLNKEPTTTLAVRITTTGDVRVAPDHFELTAANWQTGQPVTASAIDDDDAAPDQAEVTIDAPGLTASIHAVDVRDTDELAFESTAGELVSVYEGDINTFQLKLTARPAGEVRVALSSSPSVSVTPTATFTTTTWDMAQTITVRGEIDANLVNEDATITLRETTTQGVPMASVNARARDRDRLNLVANPNPMPVVEQGQPGVLKVRLNLQPPGPVRVTLTPPASGVLTLGATTLDFTTGNWQDEQDVTVTIPHDDNLEPETAQIGLSATVGQDTLTDNVTVNIQDNDMQLIQQDAGGDLQMDEGESVEFDVWLRYPPSGETQVLLESLSPGVATISPPALNFNPTNYSMRQPVRVTGVRDTNLADATANIRLSGANAATVTIGVTITDPDTQVINVTPESPVTVVEDSTAALMVSLGAEPEGPVTVAVSSADSGAVEVMSGASLSFGTNDWQSPKQVVLRAPRDSDQDEESVMITLVGGGATKVITAVVDDLTQILIFGWKNPFTSVFQDNLYSGYVYARRVNINQTGRVKKLGVRIRSGGAQFRMGLYTNVGTGTGQPGTSVAVAGPMVFAAGDRELDVDAPLTLTGDYWIVVTASVTTSIDLASAVLVPSCVAMRAFGDSAVPTGSFGPGSSCSNDSAIYVWTVIER